ncbi:hypothetical protein Btru_025071 [Bulinus truncatus]|nr:hypothetical protein Btru_025071 [Bulinus truncatus]
MFTWTFICCYHMVKTFSSRTVYTGWSAWKKFIASLVTPTVVVSAVIIGSYSTSGSSGYGPPACDLDTITLVGITLIGPMVATNLANLACFITTVCCIHKVRRLLTFRNNNQRMLWNYVKLSSLTGLFLTLDVVAEVLDSDILRIISIVLNGLQGVFICISFLCNKKVFDLYTSSLKRFKRN